MRWAIGLSRGQGKRSNRRFTILREPHFRTLLKPLSFTIRGQREKEGVNFYGGLRIVKRGLVRLRAFGDPEFKVPKTFSVDPELR